MCTVSSLQFVWNAFQYYYLYDFFSIGIWNCLDSVVCFSFSHWERKVWRYKKIRRRDSVPSKDNRTTRVCLKPGPGVPSIQVVQNTLIIIIIPICISMQLHLCVHFIQKAPCDWSKDWHSRLLIFLYLQTFLSQFTYYMFIYAYNINDWLIGV
jgi:hypothetical protein